MNKVILMGRLVKDAEVRMTGPNQDTAVGRYTLAVNRRFVDKNDPNAQNADFVNCVCFGKQADFAEKYLKKGIKIAITGRIQTGSYINKDGVKVYTTEVVIEEQEFAESKNASRSNGNPVPTSNDNDGFMNIPDNLEDDSLPFN